MDEQQNPGNHATCELCGAHSIREVMRRGERTPMGWCSVSARAVLPIQTVCIFYKPANRPKPTEAKNAIQ
jgi:hypothetical protein